MLSRMTHLFCQFQIERRIPSIVLVALLWNRPFDLRSFVPLVEGSDGDNPALQTQCFIPHLSVILAVSSLLRVRLVPRPDWRVVISRSHRGNEQRGRLHHRGARLQCRPVLGGAAVHEALRGKIGVKAVESAVDEILAITILDEQSDGHHVVLRASNLDERKQEALTVFCP